MKLFNKNKKGKIFLMLAVIFILLCMVLILIYTSNLKSEAGKNFGETQKAIINSLNKRDALNLYLQTSAELAKRDTFQSTLAENAGYYTEIYSSDELKEITDCGTHIYPMLSDIEGNICALDNDEYNLNYLKLFQENLIKYASRNRYFIKELFSGIDFNSDKTKIIGKTNEDIVLIISNKDISLDTLPLYSIKNTAVEQSSYAQDVVNKIKTINLDETPGLNLKSSSCSRFINRLLKIVYGLDPADTTQTLISNYPDLQFPGHAWVVAAKYLRLENYRDGDESTHRVVYAGEGLSYAQLKSEDNLLLPGDLLFTSSPKSWCEYTGYNEYTTTNVCGYDGDGYDGKFCTQDSINNPYPAKNPLYCDFNEYEVQYKNYPIVTHIFMYLDNDIIANFYTSKTTKQSLKAFVDTPSKSDGVRLIIRPEYPQVP